MRLTFFILVLIATLSCSDEAAEINNPVAKALYFPPTNSNSWEVTSSADLGWDQNELDDLKSYLEQEGTRAFIILKDGKIVVEEYWNRDLLDINGFSQHSQWYWASAGKSLTAVMTGIAQEKGFLNINDSAQDYLGAGWTSMTDDQEKRITIKNQLTMTTGVDYNILDTSCTDPECLKYLSDPNQFWYYHNATYTLLSKVIENATNKDFNLLTNDWIESPIGMNGSWRNLGNNQVYFSTARDAARFGLLTLAQGSWNGNQVISKDFVSEMTTSSQALNPSYGYLWWLNGKSSVVYPASTQSFTTSILPNAPSDMISAIGANEQIIDVIPSQNMVIIRMGSSSDSSPVPFTIHTEMWNYLNKIIR